MPRPVRIAVCTLEQRSLDWDGNLERIEKSCREAAAKDASLRVGIELELTGYGCLDHYFAVDTERRAWLSLARLLAVSAESELGGLLILTGMPVRHRSLLYNCMVALHAGRILLIRPKMVLCDDGIYSETRHFVRWPRDATALDEFWIPHFAGIDQKSAPFGHAVLRSPDDVRVGIEICEELWTANSPHIEMAAMAVDIVCNGSGAHHMLHHGVKRFQHLVLGSTAKLGGTYVFANASGSDGDLYYYNGLSLIAHNGSLAGHTEPNLNQDLQVVLSTVDIDETLARRAACASSCFESARLAGGDRRLPEVEVDLLLVDPAALYTSSPPPPQPLLSQLQKSAADEIAVIVPRYLRRFFSLSGKKGYLLVLDGSLSSLATFVLAVHSGCNLRAIVCTEDVQMQELIFGVCQERDFEFDIVDGGVDVDNVGAMARRLSRLHSLVLLAPAALEEIVSGLDTTTWSRGYDGELNPIGSCRWDDVRQAAIALCSLPLLGPDFEAHLVALTKEPLPPPLDVLSYDDLLEMERLRRVQRWGLSDLIEFVVRKCGGATVSLETARRIVDSYVQKTQGRRYTPSVHLSELGYDARNAVQPAQGVHWGSRLSAAADG